MPTLPTTVTCDCTLTIDEHDNVHAHPCHDDHLDPLLRRAITAAGNHQLYINLDSQALQ